MFTKLTSWCVLVVGVVSMVFLVNTGCQRNNDIIQNDNNTTIENLDQPLMLGGSPNGAQETLFYFKKATPESTYEFVEVYSTSLPIPPAGFTSTTAAQIHSLGYSTPSEALAGYSDIDEYIDDSHDYATWTTTETNGSYKRITCGSKTAVVGFPASLWLMCRNSTYTPGGPPYSRILYKSDSTYYNTWGWRTMWTRTSPWYTGINITWTQKGWHKYSKNQNPPNYSTVTKTW